MANILITMNRSLEDGALVSFRAPCACNAVTGIRVTYPVISETGVTQTSKVFTFRDSHGNVLTGLGNLFLEGALVQAMLDITKGAAYVQNADTNGYLEDKMESLQLKNQLALGNTVLSAYQYGTALPAAGTPGRIFFKKVSS